MPKCLDLDLNLQSVVKSVVYNLPTRFTVCPAGNTIKQLAHRALKHRMPLIWSDFRQRFQHETPGVHGGMWNIQAFGVDDRISEQKNIDVDDARALLL